jgi:hypothetical protein
MLNITNQFDVNKSLKELENQVISTIDDEMLKAVANLERSSPVGATKELKSGWDLVPTRIINGEFIFKVTNSAKNALQRLEGRRAGKQPPSSALEAWVAFKFKLSGKELKSVAYLVARKIGREGTNRSKRNFREFDPATGQPAKNGEIARAIARIDKKLSQLGNKL